jgi:anti-anti-sigma factor
MLKSYQLFSVNPNEINFQNQKKCILYFSLKKHQIICFTLKFNYFTLLSIKCQNMDVKIDTKEKFSVIKPNFNIDSANMSDELTELMKTYLKKDIPHLILNMENVENADLESLTKIAELQAAFYNDNFSFVMCEMNQAMIQILDDADLIDTMNITPTESEAWDIVQMEEMEREMLNDFDNN